MPEASVDPTLPARRFFAPDGGVPIDEVNASTLESQLVPGLYLCGEILDVEGRLGGFNFQMLLPYKGADGHPDLWGFGDGQKALFWLKQGKPDPASIHWGFVAEHSRAVDAFYKAAIAAGAKDNVSPRARLEYYPGYYAADVLDPDGYTFEVGHKS